MRRISKIIIHYSETPAHMDIGLDEIESWHIQRGFSEVGYHYIIRKDGRIEQGRTLDKVGAHTRGENRNSIGICYVGGENQKDDRTPEQKMAMRVLIESLMITLVCDDTSPITVHGHREFSPKKCPGFDVKTEM